MTLLCISVVKECSSVVSTPRGQVERQFAKAKQTKIEVLNMKYLLIAKRNSMSGAWRAMLTDNRWATFNVLNDSTSNLTTITMSNVNDTSVREGRVLVDDYGDMARFNEILTAMGCKRCQNCGKWIMPQDAEQMYEDEYYCDVCAHNSDGFKKIPLSGYHDTEDDVRVINAEGEHYDVWNVKGIGFEAEYWNGKSSRDDSNAYLKCNNAFYDIANPDSNNRMFRVERDCTVSGEIISNIFTKKSLYDFDFSLITNTLVINGNIPNNTNAGLHVHLSKLWLGDNTRDQLYNFLKLQYFMHCYENDFLLLCGRNKDYMDYCRFFNDEEIENMHDNIRDYADWDDMPCAHGGGVGCALNASGETIEFRIGANTNDPERMKHYLRFILGITENIKNVPFEKCYCIGRVTKLVPSDTMDYWRKHGCFLNTKAIDNRGVTF